MEWWGKKEVSVNAAESPITETNSTASFRDLLSQAFGISHKGARDVNEIYGYTTIRSFKEYYEWYRLNDYANRIVTAYPKSCWRTGVTIKDNTGKEVLKDEIAVLFRRKLFKQLENADVLNRIGSFSVLYVGLPDGLDTEEPVGVCRDLEGVYFSAFSEDGTIVAEYESDVLSPRCGMPKIYSLQKVARVNDTNSSIVEQTMPIRVHWTRVVHLAEGALDNGLIGLSCLSSVLNRLSDLNKSIGGSSEAYFRNARGKYAYKADKDFGGFKDSTEKAAFDKASQAFTNNWKDHISLVGVDVKGIDTPHHDPEGTVKVALQALAGQTGIPLRILTGEGAGQLAGSEDKASYNQMVSDRQNLICEEWVERVFEILQLAGLLDYDMDYEIEWTPIEALSDTARATLAKDRSIAFKNTTEALASVVLDGNVDVEKVYKEVLDLEIKLDMDDEDLSGNDDDDDNDNDDVDDNAVDDEDLLNG
jgi:hypothetical protein